MKTINAGGKQYSMYWVRGKVEEAGKNLETRVSGGGGGGATYGGYGATAPVTIQSHTVVHDQVFLVDAQGKEHSFQLQGFNLAARPSNELSVVWAIKDGQKTGPYIAAHNYTTGQSFFENGSLNKMFRRPGWQVLAAVAACIIAGSAVSMLYAGIFLLPIAWLVEGNMKAKKYKEEVNFNDFN